MKFISLGLTSVTLPYVYGRENGQHEEMRRNDMAATRINFSCP
jgi:hypothetical protein